MQLGLVLYVSELTANGRKRLLRQGERLIRIPHSMLAASVAARIPGFK